MNRFFPANEEEEEEKKKSRLDITLLLFLGPPKSSLLVFRLLSFRIILAAANAILSMHSPPVRAAPFEIHDTTFFPLSLLSSPAIDTREIYDTTAERKIYKYAGFSYANILTNTSFERFFPLFLFFFFVILLLLLDHTDYR